MSLDWRQATSRVVLVSTNDHESSCFGGKLKFREGRWAISWKWEEACESEERRRKGLVVGRKGSLEGNAIANSQWRALILAGEWQWTGE